MADALRDARNRILRLTNGNGAVVSALEDAARADERAKIAASAEPFILISDIDEAPYRAAERARLAALVPPMTMTVEQETSVRGDVSYVARAELYNFVAFALDELDATRAALAAEREAHARTCEARDEYKKLHVDLAAMVAAHDDAEED